MNALTGQALAQERAKAQEDIRAQRDNIPALRDGAIDMILRRACSHYAWQNRGVSDELLQTIYDITANGPTSVNCCPARFVFVKSVDSKARLAKALKDKNIDKMMQAPVTAIIAHDLEF
ncbi:nitroreductase family protein [Candidatus Halocynthiibacter alkanivorans]|uniref:nitroreductase family protein n=1 Tax=Candidatus Halocynthiibacter alkanivorans TaxID=2267619 RepID=UPI001F163C91|nr:nitroreductase family protein [Candidatus Halocynthiibacter alkanivorans]